jgi:hypothetical protein
MDPLSIAASTIAILQLTTKVIVCLGDARDASTDRDQFIFEAKNLSLLLVTLVSHIDEGSNEPWHEKVQALGGRDELIYQYRVALEHLKDKISKGHGILKMKKSLLWKYIKDEANRIMSRIERLNSLVHIALQMDHLLVTFHIKIQ